MWAQTMQSPLDAGPRLQLVQRFTQRGAFVRSLNDGRLLFRGGAWYFWNPRDNSFEASAGPRLDSHFAEDGSPDGRHLAYMVEGGVLLYDFARKDGVGRFDCATDERSICRFSPDGKLLWFACGENVGVVVLDTEEVHIEPTGIGCVDLLAPHAHSPSALVSVAGGTHPSAILAFDGKHLSITPSEQPGSASSYSPLGHECVVENDEGGYRFVAFPNGFRAHAAPARIDAPRDFERGRYHSVAYLSERLLLELSIEMDELLDKRAAPPRVSVLDRSMCTRTAEIRFTRGPSARVVPIGEPDSRGETCAIDSIDALGDGFVLTYDRCCGHRVWNARMLSAVDA